jgi:hypothetical protein
MKQSPTRLLHSFIRVKAFAENQKENHANMNRPIARAVLAAAILGATFASGTLPAAAQWWPNNPPPPRYEHPGYRAGYTWEPGHWAWVGGRWGWHAGFWVTLRPGRHYIPGHWVYGPYGRRWIPGHWGPG